MNLDSSFSSSYISRLTRFDLLNEACQTEQCESLLNGVVLELFNILIPSLWPPGNESAVLGVSVDAMLCPVPAYFVHAIP